MVFSLTRSLTDESFFDVCLLSLDVSFLVNKMFQKCFRTAAELWMLLGREVGVNSTAQQVWDSCRTCVLAITASFQGWLYTKTSWKKKRFDLLHIRVVNLPIGSPIHWKTYKFWTQLENVSPRPFFFFFLPKIELHRCVERRWKKKMCWTKVSWMIEIITKRLEQINSWWPLACLKSNNC